MVEKEKLAAPEVRTSSDRNKRTKSDDGVGPRKEDTLRGSIPHLIAATVTAAK